MSRDWRVDSLRGYFLILMTLTHLPRHPLERFTHYTFGFASAPDGFVFLSGLVSAWVYLRIRSKRGQAAMEALLLVVEHGGPPMFARVGVMRAINRHVEQVFNSSRKATHWGKRKLKWDE